jgi:hypothetical protein
VLDALKVLVRAARRVEEKSGGRRAIPLRAN